VDAGVIDRHDVGVFQRRGDARLALEAAKEGRVVGQVPGQQLQGDFAIQRRVISAVDVGHAALAQRASQLVAADYRFHR